MFGVTSLIVSAILIAGLFSLRYVEAGRGARFAPYTRARLDVFAVRTIDFFMRDLPRLVVLVIKYVVIHVTDFFSSILLRIVQFAEGKLHIAVHKVRGKKEDLTGGEPASNHLADMKSHKEAVSKTIEELEEVQ